jgi:hypothetical protein
LLKLYRNNLVFAVQWNIKKHCFFPNNLVFTVKYWKTLSVGAKGYLIFPW